MDWSLKLVGEDEWGVEQRWNPASWFIQKPNYAIVLILNFVAGTVLFGGQAYLPQEITTLFTDNALMTGVYNIPFNSMTIISGIICGFIMAKTKEAKAIIVTTFTLLLVGSGLIAVMKPHINYASLFSPTSLLGIAVGASMPILYVVVSICTPNQYIAHAMSLVASVREFGGSIGIVIFERIFTHKEDTIFPGHGF